jgi:putative transposase
MHWTQLLVYITGSVEEEFRLRIEYLVAENRILRDQIKGRVQLSDPERRTLAEIGKELSKQALEAVASMVKPDTILAWHRTLVAQKCDGSKHRQSPGRPRVDSEIEDLVLRMARENRSWGYDRIQGALPHRGYAISGRSVMPWPHTSAIITKNVLIKESAMSSRCLLVRRSMIMRGSSTVMSDSAAC